jgi:hypothetical protein
MVLTYSQNARQRETMSYLKLLWRCEEQSYILSSIMTEGIKCVCYYKVFYHCLKFDKNKQRCGNVTFVDSEVLKLEL